jgi:hypothetical protein
MSTTIEIDLMPASFSLDAIHAGVGAEALTLLALLITNFVEPTLPLIGASSLISTLNPTPCTGFTE